MYCAESIAITYFAQWFRLFARNIDVLFLLLIESTILITACQYLSVFAALVSHLFRFNFVQNNSFRFEYTMHSEMVVFLTGLLPYGTGEWVLPCHTLIECSIRGLFLIWWDTCPFGSATTMCLLVRICITIFKHLQTILIVKVPRTPYAQCPRWRTERQIYVNATTNRKDFIKLSFVFFSSLFSESGDLLPQYTHV